MHALAALVLLGLAGCASQSRSLPVAAAPVAAPVSETTQYYQDPALDAEQGMVESMEARQSVPSTVAFTAPPASTATVNYWPSDAPPTVSSSAIMVDARTGKVLFEKNADYPRPVASTQKLLTAMLVSERGNLQQKVTITEAATACEPTKLYLKAGERYTRYALLYAIMVRSANDAAASLAIDHSGSISAFGVAMTRKARSLGATRSWFANPHGLPDPNQYSSARDMAIVALAAYRDPVLRRMMATSQTTFQYEDGRQRVLTATNKLLARSTAYTGMKTGFTNASGRCLISSATQGGRHIILVQLGGTRSVVFDDAARLLQWQLRKGAGFSGYASTPGSEPGS